MAVKESATTPEPTSSSPSAIADFFHHFRLTNVVMVIIFQLIATAIVGVVFFLAADYDNATLFWITLTTVLVTTT